MSVEFCEVLLDGVTAFADFLDFSDLFAGGAEPDMQVGGFHFEFFGELLDAQTAGTGFLKSGDDRFAEMSALARSAFLGSRSFGSLGGFGGLGSGRGLGGFGLASRTALFGLGSGRSRRDAASEDGRNFSLHTGQLRGEFFLFLEQIKNLSKVARINFG